MFSFFKRKQNTGTETPPPVNAPNTHIRYDSKLIESLEADHRILLSHYQRIVDKTAEQRFKEVMAELGQFKTLFHSHILVENVKLYVYLNRTLDGQQQSAALVKEMRREMRHIGKAVNQFIDRYDDWPWSSEMEGQFADELEQIGAALSARIQTEEERLYPLYDLPNPQA